MLKAGKGRSFGRGAWRAGAHRYRQGLSVWAHAPGVAITRDLPHTEVLTVAVGVRPGDRCGHGPFLRVRLVRYWLGLRVIRYRGIASHVWVGPLAFSAVRGWR